MTEARRLRVGILLALGSTGALPALAIAGCGDVTVGPSGSAGVGTTTATTTSGSGGAGGAATTGSTTSSTTGAGGGPLCPGGNPTQQCYTLAQLEQMINNPPMGGDVGDGGPDGGVVLTECPAYGIVQNDCCNPAAAGPVEKEDTCCYEFCQSGCCGRAFVVGDRAVVARTQRRDDWLAAAATEGVGALDEATASALRRSWLRDAQMEHASIASFARFTLELLGLGAPPDLVEGSQRASLDEIEHARACFALASRYSGEPVGPGPVAIEGSLTAVDLADAAVSAVREGCVGETMAAALAAEQLSVTEDGEARSALARIVRDEEAHAELSWRFVRWAIEAGGEPVRAAVARAFSDHLTLERRETAIVTETVDVNAWHRHGRLTRAEIDRVTRAVRREVIAPCAQALLGLAAPPEERAIA